MEHVVLKRCGHYALLGREVKYADSPKFIVACGYNGKTGEWNQGYYYRYLKEATAEFKKLSGYACAKCPFINDGCTYCKR